MTCHRLSVFPAPVSHGNYDTTSNSPHLRTESSISWHGLEHQKIQAPPKGPIPQHKKTTRSGQDFSKFYLSGSNQWTETTQQHFLHSTMAPKPKNIDVQVKLCFCEDMSVLHKGESQKLRLQCCVKSCCQTPVVLINFTTGIYVHRKT